VNLAPAYRFEEAEQDYLSILDVAPDDPAAWNNLGNTNMGMQKYKNAVEYFGKAAALAPQFSFATANRCVAMFAAGSVNDSMREMRGILRKYPDLPDTRAALTAALWSVGKEADAETQWCAHIRYCAPCQT
jgi:predicted Zn-dependent protease